MSEPPEGAFEPIAPAAEDAPRQTLRLRRALLSVLGWLCLTVLLLVMHRFGMVAMDGTALTVALFVLWAVNGTILVLIVTGTNQRFEDPSLTLAQVACAVIYLLWMSYFVTELRTVVLLGILVALAFGTLQLRFGEFLVLSTIASAGYATVLALIALDEARSLSLVHDGIVWVVFSIIVFGFALLGGEASRLRTRLRMRNAALREAVRALQAQSVTDELTGIHNRRYLHTQLARHKDRTDRGGAGFFVGFADIDRFKAINDEHGHGIGDQVLIGFARMGAGLLRPFDSFARYGGEEFVFLVSDTDRGGAAAAAERLRARCEAHDFDTIAPGVAVTVSVGLTEYLPNESIDDTLGRADQGLYAAKSNGRNCVRFN